jgi:hypothetical protein
MVRTVIFYTLLFGLVVSSLAGASTPKTINIEDEYGKIRCPSGIDLNIPPGTSLELADYKVGSKLIVKVPQELSSMCEYGLLKYSKARELLEPKKPKKAVALKRTEHRQKKPKGKVKLIAQVAKKMKYATKCKEEFVSSDGLGDWGKFVKEELSSGQYPDLLKNSKPFKNVCPGFKLMNPEERKNLWVFILMSMSHYESSCRPQVEAQGPNGIAKGLLQLHEGAENKYAHWDRERICKRGDSKHPKESLQCTLSMLNGQVERFNSIFFNKSYWDVLRNVKDPSTHASKIKTAIQMLPGCGVRSVASDSSDKKKKPSVGEG